MESRRWEVRGRGIEQKGKMTHGHGQECGKFSILFSMESSQVSYFPSMWTCWGIFKLVYSLCLCFYYVKHTILIKEKKRQHRLKTYLFHLRPYHPECAWSRLISEAKQDQAWLVLGWETYLFPGSFYMEFNCRLAAVQNSNLISN